MRGLLSSVRNLSKTRYKTPIGPPHYMTESEHDMKNYKPHNTRFDFKKSYSSPHKTITDEVFQRTLLNAAQMLQDAKEISGAYAGYFQMMEDQKWSVKPGGYTGCYGSAMSTNHGGTYVLHYGDFFTGWDNPIHSSYFEYIIDEKYSPFRTFLTPGLVNTIYEKGSDGNERIKGYLVLNTAEANAAGFACIGLAHRMMHTGKNGPLWKMLLDNGFERIEAFILCHLLSISSSGIIGNRQYRTCFNIGHVPFLLSRVLLKSPVLIEDKRQANHGRTIWQGRGFNPCNSIWDDNEINKAYYGRTGYSTLPKQYGDVQARDWAFCQDLPAAVAKLAPFRPPTSYEQRDWSYVPTHAQRSPEETAALNAEIMTLCKDMIRTYRNEVENATAIAA